MNHTAPRDAETVGLIVNPVAGRGAGRRHAETMQRILARSGRPVRLWRSEGPGHVADLLREASVAGCSDVIVAGGDGSLHEAVNAILGGGLEVALGIVPIGTGNDFVKSLSTTGRWRNACERLAIALAEHRRRRIDAGRCNDFYFLNSVGAGLDGQVTAAAARFRWLPGPLAYPGALLTLLHAGIADTGVRVTLDGRLHEAEASMVIACNGAWFGGLFHIAPPARVDDGLLSVVIAAPLGRRRLIALLPKVLRGTHTDAREATFLAGRELVIETDSALPVESDGEPKPGELRRLRVSCLPGALTVVA